jgi:putative flippase GtrA
VISRDSLPGQIVRFAAVGGANTALTAAVFYTLLRLGVATAVAFTLTYAGGLAAVAFLTPRLIFGRRGTRRTKAQLLGWYGVVYTVGLAVATALDRIVGHKHAAVTIGTLLVTAPLNFLGARLILSHVPHLSGDQQPLHGSARPRGE